MENFLCRSSGAGVDNMINTSHAKIRTLKSELVFREGWRWIQLFKWAGKLKCLFEAL